MANHRQALKRAKQAEKRRQRNMAVKSRIRTRVRALRYAVDLVGQLQTGRNIHPQEVEKHLRWLSEGKSDDLKRLGYTDLVDEAKTLLASYDADKHAAVLRKLARADLKESARLIGKAASKGVVHRRTASRRVSRLTRLVNAVDPLPTA